MNRFDVPPSYFARVVAELLRHDAARVTAYVSPTLTVKATRRLYDGKIDKRDRRADVCLTVGAPNFAERKFIKTCQRAGEPFPVKKLQIRALRPR